MLGSIVHRTKPFSVEPVYVPMTNKVPMVKELQVRVIGRVNKATLHTTAYDERYDFELLMAELKIQPIEDGNLLSTRYSLHLPVHNYGYLGADVSIDFVRVDTKTNSTSLLQRSQAHVEGNSRTNISAELEMVERENMILLRVNCDAQPLPELNTANNVLLVSLTHIPPEQHSTIASPSPTEATSPIDPLLDTPVS